MKKKISFRGQTLVEFALIFPLLLLLVMGLFDVGRYVFYYAVLNTAVREGARFAIVQPLADYDSSSDVFNYLTKPEIGSPKIDADIPLSDCSAGDSNAHDNICAEVKDMTFNLGALSSGFITITHDRNDNDKPTINILFEVNFDPITPGLGLIGVTNVRVDSQMQMVYARFKDF
jgi:Flp pilus assembly protein TadG